MRISDACLMNPVPMRGGVLRIMFETSFVDVLGLVEERIVVVEWAIKPLRLDRGRSITVLHPGNYTAHPAEHMPERQVVKETITSDNTVRLSV